MITDEKQLLDRETAGHEAVENGNWRLAYDCFRDCLEYLKYYESWRENDIKKFQKLVDNCRTMIR